MLCYSLAKHARFCEPGRGCDLFPTIYNFFVRELVEKTGVLVS